MERFDVGLVKEISLSKKERWFINYFLELFGYSVDERYCKEQLRAHLEAPSPQCKHTPVVVTSNQRGSSS